MKKNVVILIQNFTRSAGSERVTAILANHLVENKYNVTVASICGDNTCFYTINKNVKLITLIHKPEVDNKKDFFNVLKSLYFFHKKNKTDICIDIFASLSIYTLILKPIFKYKNITWEHFNYNVNLGMNKFGRKLAVRYSDQIITLTERDMQFYKENNPHMRANINYIYNPSPYQNINLKQKYQKIIISVGRLTYQKGFDQLIEVWQKICEKTDWILYIIGEGEDYNKLKDLIKKNNIKNIFLTGAITDVDRYYKNASIYVSTARFEGLPMTMIEAQSFGLPIISFDYETGPSEIVKDGETGYLINDKSDNKIEIMANKLLEIMNNKEKIYNMSRLAFIASERFKNKKIIDKWLEILRGL